jgi:predicted metal-dependent hydrolase
MAPATSDSSAITVRRIPFEIPEGIDPVVIEGAPEESYLIVGLSLLLPFLEPYLVRTMKAARRHVTDPALRADLDAFNGQEGQHYRQHIRFNEAIRLQGFPELPALEAEVGADYRRYTETRSLAWNLAYAEGFEAYTSALAGFSFEVGQLDRAHPAVRDLFQWHLVEELEHRTVAFDVYEHVHGRYLYRLAVGLFAQWHLNRFVLRAMGAMLRSDPPAFRARYGGAGRAWRRVAPLMAQIVWRFYPRILATYLPWYTPHRIPLPPRAKALLDAYSVRATK